MTLKLLTETWNKFIADNCMRVAAALAYYTVFALPPLLVIILQISGLLYDREAVQDRITQEISAVAGPEAASQIRTMIEHGASSDNGLLGTVISVALLLVGASGAVAQLQAALNELWGVQPDPDASAFRHFLVKRILSFSMVLGIGFLLIVSLMATVILTAISETILPAAWSPHALQAIHFVVNFAMITALFAAIFRILPDAEVAWRDVWLGAAITSLLFIGGKFALGIYFSRSDIGSAFGAAGSLILVLAWIYYSGVILFLGAEFTHVYARLYGHGIAPASGAVRIVEDLHFTHSAVGPTERNQSEATVSADR